MGSTNVVRGARARAREAMRAEVGRVAQDLILERGYDATTVDDICAAAEISRSTFFRYFPSKEDALFGGAIDSGEQLREALVARPRGETPWIALRHALEPLIERYEADDERTRTLTRLIMNTPTLAARHREKNARWHDLLRPEIADRLGVEPADHSDPRVYALIAAALGCVEAALTAWISTEQPRALSELLDRAMSAPSHQQ